MHRNKKMALLVLLLLSLTVSSVSSAQIAGFISLGGSQYMTLRRILEELASRGHQVGQSKINSFLCHTSYLIYAGVLQQIKMNTLNHLKFGTENTKLRNRAKRLNVFWECQITIKIP